MNGDLMKLLFFLMLLLAGSTLPAAELVTVTENKGTYTATISTTAGIGKTARSDLINAPLTFAALLKGKEVYRASLPLIPGVTADAPRTGHIYLPYNLKWDKAELYTNSPELHGRSLKTLDLLHSSSLIQIDYSALRTAPPPLFPYEKVQETGADQGRIVLMVMGDGYTATEITKFRSDTETAINGLFSIAPWNKRRGAFNIYRIDVTSNESGADHPEIGTSVDTELDASYNCSGLQRLICVNTSRAQEIAGSIAAYDMVMIIVNDDTYGGSGGPVTVTSTHSMTADLVLHEFGHSFGNLADEYEDAYPGYPEGDWEPNVSYAYGFDRSQIKWNAWIEEATPLPTPEKSTYGSAIGMFEGARYKTAGIYRPRETCQMREYTHQFCEVCTEAQILQIYNFANILEGAVPAPGNITYTPGLSVTVKTLPCDSVSVSFILNGIPLTGASCTGGSCTQPIDAHNLAAGSNTLTTIVADDSGEVRNDPSHLTQVSLEWNIFFDGDVPDDNPAPDEDIETDDGIQNGDNDIPDNISDDITNSDQDETQDMSDGSDSLTPDDMDGETDSTDNTIVTNTGCSCASIDL